LKGKGVEGIFPTGGSGLWIAVLEPRKDIREREGARNTVIEAERMLVVWPDARETWLNLSLRLVDGFVISSRSARSISFPSFYGIASHASRNP
jgi:hypothetical protein